MLSVIIPVLNEEKTILKVLSKVAKQRCVFEIIVVDDGSKDKTSILVENYLKHQDSPQIKLVKHKKNRGKGSAIISGINKAKGKYIIIQDADLEYNPSEFTKLLKPLIKKETNFVLGNRWYSRRKGYFLAQMGNLYVTLLTSLLFLHWFRDTYTCYKVGPRKLWKNLKLQSCGFEIEAEITSKLCLLNYKVMELPITYKPRTFLEGKKINWRDVFKATGTLLKYRFTEQKRQKLVN